MRGCTGKEGGAAAGSDPELTWNYTDRTNRSGGNGKGHERSRARRPQRRHRRRDGARRKAADGFAELSDAANRVWVRIFGSFTEKGNRWRGRRHRSARAGHRAQNGPGPGRQTGEFSTIVQRRPGRKGLESQENRLSNGMCRVAGLDVPMTRPRQSPPTPSVRHHERRGHRALFARIKQKNGHGPFPGAL